MASDAAYAWQSREMQLNCAAAYKPGDLARDDGWFAEQLKPFMPDDGKPAIRIVSEETEAQVALALQNIRSTCQQYRGGKMSAAMADNVISGDEQVIHDFLEHLEHEAVARAASGQAADLEAISITLTRPANVGRQCELLGLDECASNVRNIIYETATKFDNEFARTCSDQVFDQDLAEGLERQRQEAGLSAPSIEHCARRITQTEEITREGFGILWQHCGSTAERWVGPWKLTRTKTAVGSGHGEIGADGTGTYTIDTSALGEANAVGEESGTLRLFCANDDCDCVNSPKQKSCLAKYGPDPVSWPRMLLQVRGSQANTTFSISGARPMKVPGPNNLGSGTYLLEVRKVDRPCEDKDLGR